jgi:hypothetical protein
VKNDISIEKLSFTNRARQNQQITCATPAGMKLFMAADTSGNAANRVMWGPEKAHA